MLYTSVTSAGRYQLFIVSQLHSLINIEVERISIRLHRLFAIALAVVGMASVYDAVIYVHEKGTMTTKSLLKNECSFCNN